MDTYRTDDIIYALATGWVRSALAVIRISGKGCIARFAPVFTASQKLLSAQNGTLVYGEVKEIDQVVVSVYRDGHGYTGEEALEISCHGSLVGIQKLLDMCYERAKQVIRDHEDALQSLVSVLLKEQTVGRNTFVAIMEGRTPEEAQDHDLPREAPPVPKAEPRETPQSEDRPQLPSSFVPEDSL